MRVKIDLSLLQEHLSEADKRPTTEAEVRQFLLDSGFMPLHDSWVVEEKDLGQLDPSEVLEVEALD
ncbi:MAG TPA: hypothetical protein VH370_04010 [Humisphaera sp.]|nr:hypothetical protein [Humisphaera sp.]